MLVYFLSSTWVVRWPCPTSRCRSVVGRCFPVGQRSLRMERWRCPSQTAAAAVSARCWSVPPRPRTTASLCGRHGNLGKESLGFIGEVSVGVTDWYTTLVILTALCSASTVHTWLLHTEGEMDWVNPLLSVWEMSSLTASHCHHY